MRSHAVLAVVILLAMQVGPTARALADGAPPELPSVRTIEELKALKPARTGDWDVRVGISDGGADAGPWELVYCHATYAGAEANPSLLPGGGQDEVLGPLLVRATDERKEKMLDRAKRLHVEAPRKEALFCQIVPVPWKAAWRVEVLNAEGEVLLRRRVEVAEPRPCYWQTFADARWQDGKHSYSLTGDGVASRPRYDGTSSLLPLDLPKEPAVAGAGEKSPHNRLPGAVPADARWSSLGTLELSAGGGQFTVRAKGAKLLPRPDRHLLARWWVNDKPVLPPRAQKRQQIQQQAEQVVIGEEMSVPAGLPRHLGALKPGDRVGLQMLYVPDGHEPLPADRALHQMEQLMKVRWGGTAAVPLASNRIEIEVTRELLGARAAE